MFTVWIVLDDSQSCYDAGGIFQAAFSTKELALEYMAARPKCNGFDLYLEEYTLDSEK